MGKTRMYLRTVVVSVVITAVVAAIVGVSLTRTAAPAEALTPAAYERELLAVTDTVRPDTLRTGGTGTGGWNQYTYAGNNPTTATDPSGHVSITDNALVNRIQLLSIRAQQFLGTSAGACLYGATENIAEGVAIGGASPAGLVSDGTIGCAIELITDPPGRGAGNDDGPNGGRSGPPGGSSATRGGGPRWGGRLQGDRGAIDFSGGRSSVDDLAGQARVARDDFAASTGSRHATVTGAYDTRTGNVVAGHSGPGFCAETHCVNQLVEMGSDPANIRFVEAVRPRTGVEVPICTRCQETYSPPQFPPGVQHQTPGPWDDL